MQKTDVNNNTALAIFFLALAVMLVGGLAVIPATETASAAPPSLWCYTFEGDNEDPLRACSFTNQDCRTSQSNNPSATGPCRPSGSFD